MSGRTVANLLTNVALDPFGKDPRIQVLRHAREASGN